MAQLVYVSHVKADAALAARLRADLLSAGVPLASDRYTVGVNWAKAIDAASHVIVCVSGNGCADEEVARAGDRSVLPVKLTAAELPPAPDGITAVDLFEQWAEGVAQLVDAIMPDAESADGVTEEELRAKDFQTGGDFVMNTRAGKGTVKTKRIFETVTVDGKATFNTGGNS